MHKKESPSIVHHFSPSIARTNHNDVQKRENPPRLVKISAKDLSQWESYVQMRSYDLLFIQNVTKIVCPHNIRVNQKTTGEQPYSCPFYKLILNNSFKFYFYTKRNPNLE